MQTGKDDIKKLYTPAVIHNNVKKFLEHRQLILINNSVAKSRAGKLRTGDANTYLSDEVFTNIIQIDGYVILEAKDQDGKDRRFRKTVSEKNRKRPTKTYIVIMDIDSKYANQSGEFAKLLKRIPQIDVSKRDFNIDIIVIAEKDISGSSHVQKKIDAVITPGTSDKGFVNIDTYPYRIFTTYMLDPNHKSIPLQSIVPKEEEEAILNSIHAEKRNLPRFKRNDPPLVWLGAEAGDIIKVEMDDESAGISLQYRLVVESKK